jgi:nitrous oxidase accessory protein NosD
MIRFTAGSILLFSLLLPVAVATGTTIVVPPGPGTPVQDAIDAAAPGDVIRLLRGDYPEQIVITKALRLRGVRSFAPSISDITKLGGSCAGGPTVTIAADLVQLRGIYVVGASDGGVQIIGRDRTKLTDVFASAYCPSPTAPTFDIGQSTRVTLNKVWASGINTDPVQQPGIRIANTPQEGRVRVKASIAAGYQVGVLLDGNGILSTRVSTSYVNFNERGILLQGTSRAIIDHNRQIIDNTTSGIELDAASSGNSIVRNSISGSVNDVLDAGSGNCWRNNTYTTGSVPSCP